MLPLAAIVTGAGVLLTGIVVRWISDRCGGQLGSRSRWTGSQAGDQRVEDGIDLAAGDSWPA